MIDKRVNPEGFGVTGNAPARFALSRPYPNSLIERYERQIALIVDHAKTKKGGYVKGLVPTARQEFVKMYVNIRLKQGWNVQTEIYKGAVEEKQREAKEKSLEELVQTESPLDAVAPAVGLGVL